MKTNEWLAYFVAEHQGDLITLLQTAAATVNLQPNTADLASVCAALESDFDAETFQATADAFSDLGADKSSIKILWGQVQQKLVEYIGGEDEMSGGAKRLAYLRLSTFTQELNSAWQ